MAFEWLLFTKVLLRFWPNRYGSSMNITHTRESHTHPSHHITISFSTHFLFNPISIYLQSLHWSLWSKFATFLRRWPCTQALTNSRLGTIETESSIEHRFSTILRSWIETGTLSPRESTKTDGNWRKWLLKRKWWHQFVYAMQIFYYLCRLNGMAKEHWGITCEKQRNSYDTDLKLYKYASFVSSLSRFRSFLHCFRKTMHVVAIVSASFTIEADQS